MTLVVLLGLGLTSVANADTPDVGWWKLDEGSGTTAVDTSVNGNNGTLFNGPQWVAGKTDGALDLDGINDYVDCGNAASLNITGAITVAAWVKTNDSGNGEHNPYVTKGDHAFSLKHRNDNNVSFFVYVNSGWRVAMYPVDSSFNGVWHHLAGTYDGTNVKFYVDGTLQATTAYTGTINSTTYPVNIGRNSEITSRLYDGLIDDVRIYSSALAQADISAIVNGFGSAYASNPNPANGATGIGTDATLSWTPGVGARSHNVYFGASSPGSFVGNQAGSTFDPSGIQNVNTKYYWRIDELDADDVVIATGDVWSYTTALVVLVDSGFEHSDITGVNQLKNMKPADGWQSAKSDGYCRVSDKGSLVTIPGLLANNQVLQLLQGNDTGTVRTRQDISKSEPGEIGHAYHWAATEVYALSFNASELAAEGGSNPTQNAITVNLNQINPGGRELLWTTTVDLDGTHPGGTGNPGDWTAAQLFSFTISAADFVPGPTGYLELEFVASGASGSSCYLDNVTLVTIPDPLRVASSPSPSNGQTEVDCNGTILSWQPGSHAIQHRIWFGAEDPANMVEKPVQDLGNEQYDPGDLIANTAYYWRIDEVNSDLSYESPGTLWQFTTGTEGLFPLLIYDAEQLGGTGVPVDIHTVYSDAQIPGGLNNKISSFRLAKGYMLTVACESDGHGPSKVYVAYDKDIVVNVLPTNLKNAISFIRVVPWRYGTKKGTAGSVLGVDASWFYLWSVNGQPDLPEREYVPMSWGGGEAQPDDIAGYASREDITNWLSFNEPDYCNAQSGQYWDLCTVSTAVGYYENLMGIGLRLGSPATHEEGWDGWLNTFVNQATAADMRVDFIAIHWYDWESQPSENPNPAASAVFGRLKNHLNKVYQKYKRPIWLTEWNANLHRSRSIQDAFLQLAMPYMDKLGYVERYSYFQPSSGTGDFFDANGNLTTTGTIYKNHVSPDNFAQSFPAGWQNQDIGSTGVSGTTIYANGIFTVSGSGADIWGISDEFQYAYIPITGDGEFIAKVDSMITAHNASSKAGVMIRNTLAANSAHAMMDITSSSGAQFQYRAAAGGTTAGTTAAGYAAPYWVKIVRSGNSFSGYRSPNGTSWTQVGSTVTIPMNATVYAGLCVTSHNDAKLCDAIFTDLRLSWPKSADINEDTHVDLQDFGILSKCWQGTGTVPCLNCDLDYSGDVDLADLQLFADAWLGS
jgi:hypothetical protein